MCERWVLLLLLASGTLSASAKPRSANWAACFESLQLPTDSVMVPFTRGTYTVEATVSFDSRGKENIRLSGGTFNARQSLEFSFAGSRFRGVGCAGRTVVLLFTFVIEGSAASEAYPTRTFFEPPNRFVIHFRPQLEIQEISPPPGSGRHEKP